jgi:Flp pilus assembly protein TadG
VTKPTSRRRQRGAQAGQGLIELALLIPILMAVVLLTINAEWSIFQVQELQDAANGAVRAMLVNGPHDTGSCDDKTLSAIRHAAAILPISTAPNQLCSPSPGQTNELVYHDTNLSICITSDPTISSPSHVAVVVTDHLTGLVPISLFNITVTATSETTNGASGVPGTVHAPYLPCP